MLYNYRVLNDIKSLFLSPEINNLKESWWVGPVGLSFVGKVANMKLYSSQGLVESFLNAIKKQKVTKPIYNHLLKLVNKKTVIPCYANRSIIRLIGHRLFGKPWEKGIMAFYDPESNKVYMLFDNRVKMFIWADDQDLSETLIHELMHYAAFNTKQKFYSIFKRELETYYTYFFGTLFNHDKIMERDLKVLVYWLFRMYEWNSNITTQSLKQYNKLLTKSLSTSGFLSRQDKIDSINEYLNAVNLFLSNQDVYIGQVNQYDSMPRYIYDSLITAYSNMGYSNLYTLAVQECVFPSEVVAIMAGKRANSNHYAAIKSIR